MIRVARVGADSVIVEDFEDARSFAFDGGGQHLVLFRDARGTQPLIAFASGVWLSAEVISDG